MDSMKSIDSGDVEPHIDNIAEVVNKVILLDSCLVSCNQTVLFT